MDMDTNDPQEPYVDPSRAARVEAARRFEGPPVAQYVKDYINPADVANFNPILSFTIVTEIWMLEKYMRDLVKEAQDPKYKITFENAEAMGAPHSKWAAMLSSTIEKMTSEERSEMRKVAVREVIFLRNETTQLQGAIHDRDRAMKQETPFEPLEYPATARPSDGIAEPDSELGGSAA